MHAACFCTMSRDLQIGFNCNRRRELRFEWR